MRKWASVLIMLGAFSAACAQDPQYVAPPATEYAVARSEVVGRSTDTLQVATVSPEFMRVIGVKAVLGRLFIGNDFQPTGSPTAVLNYDVWMRRFGGDPAIIGKPIRLNGTDAIVVGVTPRNFEFPKGAALWVPRRGVSDRR